MKRCVCLMLVLLVLGGCSVVLPSHARLIDQHAGNAAAINAKVQADPTLPAEVKTWWAAEAQTWTYLSDWAHGRRPAPAK